MYIIEYDKNGPFMRQFSPGDYTWGEAVRRLKVLRREWNRWVAATKGTL